MPATMASFWYEKILFQAKVMAFWNLENKQLYCMSNFLSRFHKNHLQNQSPPAVIEMEASNGGGNRFSSRILGNCDENLYTQYFRDLKMW